MDRKEQIEQEELERLESNAGVYDDTDPISDKHLNYLKCVLISQLLLEANDDLKGSKAFKQNVKYQVGKTNQILEKVYQEGFNTVYHNNPEMCLNVLNKIDGLIHKIKTATIDELVMIDALVDQYFNNKEEINETQTAEFTKID
tara:strand:- start:354 stop:785 length:432 start_codon:yes stop_codon:yes gene_type:complete